MRQIIADFKVDHKAELYEKLDAAVAAAHTDALTDGKQGVLMTRHDFGHFSVTLSPNVPFGIIQEDDQALRT
jgi:hypothetical protein